ncbi:arylamine N-acetyltransferase family protein [Mycolicibacterium thermoresistibile]
MTPDVGGWGRISRTDLTDYLGRIGYTGPAEATADTLAALVVAHTRTIPFENLDPMLGRPVADLSPAALIAKVVRRRRGGYCFEHNGVMALVLERLGFGVERLGARVVWGNPTGALPAQTHQLLSVTVPGVDGPTLVDVGFGGQTPTSPLRLQPDIVQPTRHEPYRVIELPHGYRLEVQIRAQWEPLYLFTTAPQPRIDAEVASWYVSTHPGSNFVNGLSAAIVTDDARVNLRGRHLSIHRANDTERIRFDTAAEVLDALTERFGIDPTDLSGVDVERRLAEVLDA